MVDLRLVMDQEFLDIDFFNRKMTPQIAVSKSSERSCALCHREVDLLSCASLRDRKFPSKKSCPFHLTIGISNDLIDATKE